MLPGFEHLPTEKYIELLEQQLAQLVSTLRNRDAAEAATAAKYKAMYEAQSAMLQEENRRLKERVESLKGAINRSSFNNDLLGQSIRRELEHA